MKPKARRMARILYRINILVKKKTLARNMKIIRLSMPKIRLTPPNKSNTIVKPGMYGMIQEKSMVP